MRREKTSVFPAEVKLGKYSEIHGSYILVRSSRVKEKRIICRGSTRGSAVKEKKDLYEDGSGFGRDKIDDKMGGFR